METKKTKIEICENCGHSKASHTQKGCDLKSKFFHCQCKKFKFKSENEDESMNEKEYLLKKKRNALFFKAVKEGKFKDENLIIKMMKEDEF